MTQTGAVAGEARERLDLRAFGPVLLEPKMLLDTGLGVIETLDQAVPESNFRTVAGDVCRLLQDLPAVTKAHLCPFTGRRLLRPLLVAAILGAVALLGVVAVRAHLELRLPNWWDSAQGFAAVIDLILLIVLTLWSDLGGGKKKMVERHLFYLARLRNLVGVINQYQAKKLIPLSANSATAELTGVGDHIKSLEALYTYLDCAQDLFGLVASAVAYYVANVTEEQVLGPAARLQELTADYRLVIDSKMHRLTLIANRRLV